MWAPARVAAATGSTLFAQSFANNTVNTAYPVSVPAAQSGTNSACLTASGNSSSGALLSCPTSNDAQGSGKLRLTSRHDQPGGRRLRRDERADLPGHRRDVQHLPVRRHRGGRHGVRAGRGEPGQPAVAVDHRAARRRARLFGLRRASAAWPTPTWASASMSTVTSATACTRGAAAPTPRISPPAAGCLARSWSGGQATARSATAPSTAPRRQRHRRRSRSVRPPAPRRRCPSRSRSTPPRRSFTTASGITVAAGTYKVVFTPVGGSATTLSGALPVVPSGLYPSSTWTDLQRDPEAARLRLGGLHRVRHRLPRGRRGQRGQLHPGPAARGDADQLTAPRRPRSAPR